MAARVPASFLPSSRPKKTKYSSEKATVDGTTFDSKAEAARYVALRNLLNARDPEDRIANLEVQPTFYLYGQFGPLVSDAGRHLIYKADFAYTNAAGERIIEDVKGFKTKEYKLKRAIMRAMGFEIVEV